MIFRRKRCTAPPPAQLRARADLSPEAERAARIIIDELWVQMPRSDTDVDMLSALILELTDKVRMVTELEGDRR